MTFRDLPPPSVSSHDDDTSPEARGALLVADIETSLGRLKTLYSERQAENKLATYTLENKGMLEYAGIPTSITNLINMANKRNPNDPLSIDSAYIDIEIGKEQLANDPSALVLTFHLKSSDTLVMIRAVSPAPENPENGDSIITHFYGDEIVGDDTKRVFKEQDTVLGKVITDTELYDFLASIAFIRDHDLSASSMVNKDLFRQYVHNPFSISDLHRLFNQSAELTRQESLHPVIDPVTGLPADITVCKVDEDSVSIEVDLWEDMKRTRSTSIALGVAKPLKDSDYYDGFFGAQQKKRPSYLENSLVSFEQSGFRHTPSIFELEEIKTKLEALVDISDVTAQIEELSSFDEADEDESDEDGFDSPNPGA